MILILQQVPFKNFSSEVRAANDVKKFLDQTYLLINFNQSNPDVLVDALLAKMLSGFEPKVIEGAKTSLFTHDRSKLGFFFIKKLLNLAMIYQIIKIIH